MEIPSETFSLRKSFLIAHPTELNGSDPTGLNEPGPFGPSNEKLQSISTYPRNETSPRLGKMHGADSTFQRVETTWVSRFRF